MIRFLFFSGMFFFQSCSICLSTNHKMFSSKIISSKHLDTLIVMDEKVMIRRINNPLNKDINRPVEKPKNSADPIIDNQKKVDISEIIPESKYEYLIPSDDCYYLENLNVVCIDSGKIRSIKKHIKEDLYATENEVFFNQNSLECNQFKFDTIYDIFVLKSKFSFHDYQMIHDDYPEFIRMIFMSDKDVAGFEKPRRLLGKIKVFYLSIKNDIGCVPYSKIVLYGEGKSKLFKLKSQDYRIVGPYLPNYFSEEDVILAEIDGPNVLSYGIRNYEDLQHKPTVENAQIVYTKNK